MTPSGESAGATADSGGGRNRRELERIEADVVIDFTVLVNQTSAAFGKRNSNLTGAATTTTGNGGSFADREG
jgi:hypothetical protein